MTGRTSFSTLRDRMSPEAQARASAKSDLLQVEMALGDLRRDLALSQGEVAAILEVNQTSVARMEKRKDMHVMTLQRIIQAMGGELDIIARFSDRQVKLKGFTNTKSTAVAS